MWICQIFLTLILMAQHSVCNEPPATNAIFYSIDFRNILLWNFSRDRHQSDTVYNVQYKIYGQPWFNKSECHKITEEYCDLTNETGDVSQEYFARVLAESRDGILYWKISSQRFSPRRDTHLGPPMISYTEGVTSVQLQIHPPLTPLISEDGSQQSIENIYEKYKPEYHIVLKVKGAKEKERDIKIRNKSIEISQLLPGTEYCGNVTIEVESLRKESKPKSFCFKTLQDRNWLFSVLIACVFFIGMATAAAIYAVVKYIMKEPRMPKSLLNFLPHDHRRLPACPDSESIVSIECLTQGSSVLDSLLKFSAPIQNATESDQAPIFSALTESNGYASQVSRKSYGTSFKTKGFLRHKNYHQPDLSSVTTNSGKEALPENSHVSCKSRVTYALLLPPVSQQSGYRPQTAPGSQNVSDEFVQVTNDKWKSIDASDVFCPNQADKSSVETRTSYKEQRHFSPVSSELKSLALPGYKPTGQIVLETECRNGKLYLPLLCSLHENDNKIKNSSDQIECLPQSGETLSLLSSVMINGALFAEDEL
ncbi:interleukin-22 receptor subunit alpha-1 [Protopterus annectens]|uniref:interleukin-22 receptor subunit alpha-1 n=1 Tax=Protopterus annectens TaxID=7888 RepID=UPI001CFBE9B1|nr:interleukin-22 receptor subunit alpha-1 [Protopterus annectens]